MYLRKIFIVSCTLILSTLSITPAYALDVKISRNISRVSTAHNGEVIKIQRIQDQSNVLAGGYTKTSRKCPPFCIQPMKVAPGVTTVGELEVLDFIKNELNKGTGVLIDARTSGWYTKGTIPGSINIPFTTFSKDSSELVKTAALSRLGVTTKTAANDQSFIDKMMLIVSGDSSKNISSRWDFATAKSVLLWCNGIWCGQSPRAIKGMLALGYPADKIYYYRGGMQAWKSLGLTVK
ncbi:hypothetical protein MNBD_GAMMA10-3191 [hydrothermal vent metagenome]|uniref:Rhodanese domain-containing protein n=1 Tax=hydrothermal vent metagenome TaxID=652676 RepID=A0A3B0Y4X6_9ZZZZ